jgi:hypothetical protein
MKSMKQYSLGAAVMGAIIEYTVETAPDGMTHTCKCHGGQFRSSSIIVGVISTV